MIKEAMRAGRLAAVKNLLAKSRKLQPYLDDTLEIAGLASIATPYVADMAGKKMKRSVSNAMELGGLMTLMVPSLRHMRALKRLKKPVG